MRGFYLIPLLLALAFAPAHAQQLAPARQHSPAAQSTDCADLEVSAGAERRCLKPGGGEPFRDCPTCPEMVVVPSGSFTMGSPQDEPGQIPAFPAREHPQHKVTIKQPFAVARFATTLGEYAEFVGDAGYKNSDEKSLNKNDKCYAWAPDPKTQSIFKSAKYFIGELTGMQLGQYPNWRAPEIAQTDRHPVVCVGWADAEAYVAWLSKKTGKNYRLLTEAEWEYVARAGTTTPFWWGSSISSSQAYYDGRIAFNGGPTGEWRQTTMPVDSFQQNPWGLYQVHGNVSEWVEDCWNGNYGSNYQGAPTDGSAWNPGNCPDHVMRNGGWVTGPGLQRAAARSPYSRPANILGFRVARSL